MTISSSPTSSLPGDKLDDTYRSMVEQTGTRKLMPAPPVKDVINTTAKGSLRLVESKKNDPDDGVISEEEMVACLLDDSDEDQESIAGEYKATLDDDFDFDEDTIPDLQLQFDHSRQYREGDDEETITDPEVLKWVKALTTEYDD